MHTYDVLFIVGALLEAYGYLTLVNSGEGFVRYPDKELENRGIICLFGGGALVAISVVTQI